QAQLDIVVGLPSARLSAMQVVLGQNYEPVGFDLSITEDNWPGYVSRIAGQQLRGLVHEITGVYDFLDTRDHTASNPWVVDARCPGLRHELRRRGVTTLDPAGRWQSVDTQSFHALRSNRWIGCYYREYPMGWGWIPTAAGQALAAPHVSDPP